MNFLKYPQLAIGAFCIVFGTFPVRGESPKLAISIDGEASEDRRVQIQWLAESGQSYALQSAPALFGPWGPVLSDPILGEGELVTIEAVVGDATRYFRTISGEENSGGLQREFGLAPAGTAFIGTPESDSDEAQFEVVFTRDLLVQTTETTNLEFVEVMTWALEQGHVAWSDSDNGFVNVHGRTEVLTGVLNQEPLIWDGSELQISEGGETLPVVMVTWYGAMAYAHYLSLMEERASAIDLEDWSMDLSVGGYRLPSEAEWEYACRAGTSTVYFTGDDPESLVDAAWFSWNSEDRLHNVGQKAPNPWGLYDTLGNAMEWVWDAYDDYPTGTVTDYLAPEPEVLRRLRKTARGGTFSDSESRVHAARRLSLRPDSDEDSLSFRIVRSAIESQGE